MISVEFIYEYNMRSELRFRCKYLETKEKKTGQRETKINGKKDDNKMNITNPSGVGYIIEKKVRWHSTIFPKI